jgi:hypothetical protein
MKSHFRGIITIELDEKTHLEHLKGVRNITTQEGIVLIIATSKISSSRADKRGESTTISTEDIIKNPFKGIGKSEVLKYNLQGT